MWRRIKEEEVEPAGPTQLKKYWEGIGGSIGRKEHAEEVHFLDRKKMWMNAEEHAEEESSESDTLQQMDEEESAHFFAMKWLNQDGSDHGIPKKYTPCVYFFNAKNGCRDGKKCDFSHDEELFLAEPFRHSLKNLSWDRNHHQSGRSGSKYTFQKKAWKKYKYRARDHYQEPRI